MYLFVGKTKTGLIVWLVDGFDWLMEGLMCWLLDGLIDFRIVWLMDWLIVALMIWWIVLFIKPLSQGVCVSVCVCVWGGGGLLQYPFRIFPPAALAFFLRLSFCQFTHHLSRYPCIYEKKIQKALPCKRLGGRGLQQLPRLQREGEQQK